MAVYLSPGVFPVEIDLSALPTAVGPLTPAFIGTATMGPMNTPTYVTSSQQYIDTFGTPTPVSYLGYAVLAYMASGNNAYVMRVGIECQAGQPTELDNICIDTSGTRTNGWGRIPLYTGIDYGHINLRAVTNDNPVAFQLAAVTNIEYNDAALSSTFGPTVATLTHTGTYSGAINDSIVMIITGPVTGNSPVAGATYQIVRNSDGAIIAADVLTDPSSNGTSNAIALGNGITIKVAVSSGEIDTNDTFIFDLVPDNETFTVSVEGDVPTTVTVAGTYTDPNSLVNALNSAVTLAYSTVGLSAAYLFVLDTLADGVTVVPQIRSLIHGRRIQITGTQGWALAVGTQQYAWDIPRSYLIGLEGGPYSITTQNNQVVLQVIGNGVTQNLTFNLPIGLNQTPQSIAAAIEAASLYNGQKWFDSFTLMLPDGTVHVFIAATLVSSIQDHSLDLLNMLANYSNLKTMRFADTLAIMYPYQRPYRGYYDDRVALPAASEEDPAIPASCDVNPTGSTCVADSAYYAGIVGWLVATTPGTWLNGWSVQLSVATGVPGNAAGLYNLSILDGNGVIQDAVQAVSFDMTQPNYIGNVLNPGSSIGGVNGDKYINWEPRPSYLNFDPTDPINYVVRNPSPLNGAPFIGMADGIPTDPAYSSDLDAAVIGNPAEMTGMYAFQNPETIDINLLLTPGFSSGAVIGQALSMCEARGDVLYLVDPPFGLRPQQVVDWHNGMLTSDLTAAINSSYGALYWGWLQTFDQFNNIYVWVPPSGSIAGVFSYTAQVAEQWYAPAGLNRGIITEALDVEYSPSQGERDLLYGSGNAVNPIVKFPKDGITVWGQRTLQREQTALDRVNVRMLLIFIKKNLIQLLRTYIFEPNDTTLWAQVTSAINPFLSDIMARRGLTGFNVICDATNNTPERIDANQLWVSVFLKPTRAVEFIALNLVVMQTGASFSAENVLAAGGIVTS